MASKNLPTDLTGGESGHPGLHNDVHDVVNEFDYDALIAAADGQVIKKSAGLWTAGTDVQGGGGFGRDMGVRYVHPSGSDADDGLSPATAKATIQAAVDSITTRGLVQILAQGGFFTVPGIVRDNGKNITFAGMGAQSTRLRFGSNFHPMFYLTGRWSGVRDLEINADTTVMAQSGHGGIILGERNTWVERVNFWNIGAGVTASFEAADPLAPYAIKVLSRSTTEDTYPTLTDTQLSDWTYVNHVYFFHTYRGLVLLGGVNGSYTHMMGEGGEKGAAIYIERGDSFLNSSGVFGYSHLVIDPANHPVGHQDSGYIVYITHIGTLDFGNIAFVGMRTESFGNGPAHYFTDIEGCIWTGCRFGGTGNQQAEIEFSGTANSAESKVGANHYTRSGGPAFVNASNVKFAQMGSAAGHA